MSFNLFSGRREPLINAMLNCTQILSDIQCKCKRANHINSFVPNRKTELELEK